MIPITWLFLFLLQFQFLGFQVKSQQTYINNDQLDCDRNSTAALGNICNSPITSCLSYLTFRSNPPYNSPTTIGSLLNSNPSKIAKINNISVIDIIPTNTLLIIPITCSCYNNLYKHNATYVLKTEDENYFTMANNTYEGLTTCQALRSQNPYNYRYLKAKMRINVPLSCACPTTNQTQDGFRYLLSYLITWDDYINKIAGIFVRAGADNRSMFTANDLSPPYLIFPFTTILVPLKTPPTQIDLSLFPPPSAPSAPMLPTTPVRENKMPHRKWIFICLGVGGVGFFILLLIFGLSFCFFRSRRRRHIARPSEDSNYIAAKKSRSPMQGSDLVSSNGVRHAIQSLVVYEFDDLHKATGSFGDANRIRGSVYRGSFNGDYAAIKIMKGDVSCEINILKEINHFNVISLSGFCVHQGNTYLVYEYGENGSLRDCLDMHGIDHNPLSWKQRVQIAYDIANGLNYLHNYTNPPYIHKNLKSSNVLLDKNMRGKIGNFGLARTLENEGDNSTMLLTKHVVGTFGYMAPEYIENGLITTKLDVFAFGVVLLEILSGREATKKNGKNEEEMLCVAIREVVKEKIEEFMDPHLKNYSMNLAYTMVELAKKCVAHDLNSRPPIEEIVMTLSKVVSSSLEWNSSCTLEHSMSLSCGR